MFMNSNKFSLPVPGAVAVMLKQGHLDTQLCSDVVCTLVALWPRLRYSFVGVFGLCQVLDRVKLRIAYM